MFKKKLNLINDLHLKELLSKSFFAMLLRILGLGFAYLFSLYIARVYGAENWGLFSLSLTLILIFSTFGRFGLDTTLLKFISGYYAKEDFSNIKGIYLRALSIIIPITILFSIILFILSSFLAIEIFKNNQLIYFLKIGSLGIFPLVLLFLNAECIRALKDSSTYVFLKIVSFFLFPLLILFLFHFVTKNYYHSILSLVIGLYISFIMSQIIWFKKSKFFLVKTKYKITYNKLLKISIPLLFASSLFLILDWTDTLMLSYFKSEIEVGIYSIALRLAEVTSLTLFAINAITAPKIADFYENNQLDKFKKIIKQSTILIFLSSLPIMIVLFIFSSFFMGLFGEEFKIGANVLMILVFGQFINSISGSVGYILKMTGHQKAFQNIILFGVFLNVILNLILIPKFGMVGAAIASIISMSFWNIASVIFIKKKFGFWTFPFI